MVGRSVVLIGIYLSIMKTLMLQCVSICSIYILHSDVDECAIELDTCDDNANCTNTDGSYDCTCREGYTGDGENCTSQYM